MVDWAEIHTNPATRSRYIVGPKFDHIHNTHLEMSDWRWLEVILETLNHGF